MSYFHARTLFDGHSWLSEQSFFVDQQGLFRSCSIEQANDNDARQLGVVIPGFINCHSHSFQRAMAGTGERINSGAGQDSFWSWRKQMYHLVQHLTPETFKQVADWLYVEMLEAGFTSVGEFHYLHNQPDGSLYEDRTILAKTLYQSGLDTGLRVCMLPVLYKNGGIGKPLEQHQLPFGMKDLDDYLQYQQALAPFVPNGHGLGACAHSIRGVDKQTLQAFASHYNDKNVPIHIHIAEQPAEVEDSIASLGKRPVEFLLDDVGINQNWTLVHATHVNEYEIKGMAKVNAVVGICPLTEANLGDGIFPMTDFMAQKGAIAIGSDSHIRIDPFEELRLIEYSQRYKLLGRACLADEENVSPGLNLARACYKGGEQSLKLNVGALRDGVNADFIELKDDHPAMLRQQADTLWDELIFAAGKEVVNHVFVAGKQVVSNGRHDLAVEKLENLKRLYQSIAKTE